MKPEKRKVEQMLRAYRNDQLKQELSEQQLIKAVAASRRAFYEGEYSGILTRTEFLFWQISYIKKRWWLLQLLVLTVLWGILYASESGYYMQRSMGAVAPVFAVLLIPELWKNRMSDSMEIEGASYFNLQQIYAARMFAFGLVDIFLLSIFCSTAILTCHLPVKDMLIHFILPLAVTASICYRTLCSRWCRSASLAVTLCLVWTAFWTLIILNENLYDQISESVWAGVLVIVVVYLFYAIGRAWRTCKTPYSL